MQDLQNIVVNEFKFIQSEEETLNSLKELECAKSITSGISTKSYFKIEDFDEFEGRAIGRGNVFPMSTSDELYSLLIAD